MINFGERTRPRVLAMASRHRGLLLKIGVICIAGMKAFRRGAEMCTRGACAPQNKRGSSCLSEE